MRRIALLLVILAIISACMRETTPSAVEALSVAAAVDSLWTGYAHASDRKDATAFGALFTEDATLVFSGTPSAHGREAIKTFLVTLYADLDPRGLRVQAEETKVSGALAVQSGTFEESFVEKGTERIKYGRYVLVAERGSDRAWKIRRLAAIVDTTE